MVLAAALVASAACADGNIDPAHAFAWSENAGWSNFAPTGGGVTVTTAGLSGYAWAENIGWIKLAATGSTYENTTKDNWDVKLIGRALRGYAWSESAGWINFAPSNGGVTIESDGYFVGYAWGENVGWIRFQNAAASYGVRTTAWAETVIFLR